jgi:amino acid adenylation domain-containing protein
VERRESEDAKGHEESPAEYPLLPMQASMLFNGLAQPGAELQQVVIQPSAAHTVSGLRAGFTAAIERHAMLRTTLRWRDREHPVAQVHAASPLAWAHEHSPLPLATALPALLERDRAAGLDPSRLPVTRFTQLQAQDGEALLWTFHHAHLDGRSIQRVLSEVLRTALGAPAPSAPSPAPAIHARAALSTALLHSASQHFAEHLRGLHEPPPTPGWRHAPKPPPPATLTRTMEAAARVDPLVMHHVDALAKDHQLSWASVVHGAWALLLARFGHTDDVVFGVTRACRTLTEHSRDTVGCLINTAPLRVTLAGSQTVAEFLTQVRRDLLAQRPFETLGLREAAAASELHDPRQLVRSIVVCEAYSLEEALHQALPEAHGWHFRLVGQSAAPLTLAVNRTRDGGADVVVEHDPALVSSGVAATLATAMGQVLSELAARPGALLSQLESPVGHPGLAGPHPPAPASALSVRLQRAFQAHGAALAVLHVETGERVSFQQLGARAEALACELQRRGAQPGDVVAAMAMRSVDTLVTFAACALAGFVYVPVDASYPTERVHLLLEDCGARFLVGPEAHPPAASGARPMDPTRIPAGQLSALSQDPEALAYVLYTSGTTGRPKGVCVPQRALVAHAEAITAELQLTHQDRVLQFASPSFDVYLEEVVPTLLAGASVVIRDDHSASSAERLLDVVRREGVTLLQLPTAFFNELAHHLTLAPQPLPACLRAVVIGGERANHAACRRFRAVAPEVRLFNAYGPTEVTITATCHELGAQVPNDVPIGRPIGACRAYIVDKHGRPAPEGARGELVLGGPQVAQGYLNRTDETLQRFVPDPVDASRGVVYRTGDLVRLDEHGHLVFEGRVDAQVKVRGFRIELGEVERALEAHPDVAEAVATVLASPVGEPTLVAFVVAHAATDTHRIRQALTATLPAHMVPARIGVVPALPRSTTGKLDRRALTWPADAELSPPSTPDQPATPLEASVRALFREVLADPALGLDDSFFDRGGSSIRALRLVGRIEDTLRASPTVATLITHPSPRALARWMVTARDAAAPNAELVPLNEGAEGPTPVYCVVGLHAYATIARGIRRRRVVGVYVAEELEFPGDAIRVEPLAGTYLRAIQQGTEPPPKILVGISFGAFVAFEMAQQLHARGTPPDLIVLLDPRLPSMLEPMRFEPLLNLAARLRTDPLAVPERARQRLQRLVERKPAAGPATPEQQTWQEREAAYGRALAAYEPVIRPYSGRALVYLAGDDSPARLPSAVAVWRTLVGQGSEVTIVPGTHGTLLQDPSASHIASLLEATLRKRPSSMFAAVKTRGDS